MELLTKIFLSKEAISISELLHFFEIILLASLVIVSLGLLLLILLSMLRML